MLTYSHPSHLHFITISPSSLHLFIKKKKKIAYTEIQVSCHMAHGIDNKKNRIK